MRIERVGEGGEVQRRGDVFCHWFCGFVSGEPDLRGGEVFGGSACVSYYCAIWNVIKGR